MMSLKKFVLCIAGLASATGLMSQRGLSLGPSVSFGQVFSKNIILSDTSQYYVKNGPGMFANGGLDVVLGVTDHVSFHAGVGYTMKQFNLKPTDNETGETFPDLNITKMFISIPMAVHYRIPLKKEGGKTFINFMAGHTLDMIKKDSSSVVDPNIAVIDSGGSYSQRIIQYDKRLFPTVTLGVGMDFVNAKGSALDISLVWGFGTGKMVRGDIKEWTTLDKQFNQVADIEPQEFPDHYFDYAIRGSYLSLRVSYWFNTGLLKGKPKVDVEETGPTLPPLRNPNDPDDR